VGPVGGKERALLFSRPQRGKKSQLAPILLLDEDDHFRRGVFFFNYGKLVQIF
jgi:hypothetical protein